MNLSIFGVSFKFTPSSLTRCARLMTIKQTLLKSRCWRLLLVGIVHRLVPWVCFIMIYIDKCQSLNLEALYWSFHQYLSHSCGSVFEKLEDLQFLFQWTLVLHFFKAVIEIYVEELSLIEVLVSTEWRTLHFTSSIEYGKGFHMIHMLLCTWCICYLL